MSKAEKFIRENTKNCGNVCSYNSMECAIPWLTTDEARMAVEIAREETLQEVKEKLLIMLNTSIDNKHFFEQLDDFIDDFCKALEED